jgi:hypothetical protein
MKQILSFIRIVDGAFEKVTWYKNTNGTKHCTKEPATPTPEQLQLIARSPYSETYC